MHFRGSRSLILGWTAALALTGHATAGEDSDADEPMPVSVKATPAAVWAGETVTLAGASAAGGGASAVTLEIKPPAIQGKPGALVTLHGGLDAEGNYSENFSATTMPGTYEVEAVAPDGRGTARTRFRVTDAGTMSVEAGPALADAVGDEAEIVDVLESKLRDLPPSPAKDEVLQKLAPLKNLVAQLKQQAPQATEGLRLIIEIGEIAQYRNPERRQQLARAVDDLQKAHSDARTLLAKLKPKRNGCDDLEVIVEGFKFASFLFNLGATPAGIGQNYFNDVIGYVTGKIAEAGGENAAFGSSELGKNAPALIKAYKEIPGRKKFGAVLGTYKSLAGSAGGIAGDVGALVAGKTLSAYCEQFTGPVTAHMKAQFFTEAGIKWWEYEFDLAGVVTVHYPKSASGDTIAVKGRIEGNAKNFKVWENGLQVLYPKLMTSAYVKKFVIPVEDMSTLANQGRNIEGSVVGAHLPSAFFFDCTGVVTKDRIDLVVGPARTDIDAAATVVAFSASVLSLGLNYYTYRLPYKNAHFIFEKAADTFDIPLSTRNKVIRGKRHFEKKKDAGTAKGEYTVDIEMCNPGCT